MASLDGSSSSNGHLRNRESADAKAGRRAQEIEEMRRNRSLRDKLADLYLVYELRTALYSLEPWEKALFSEYLVLLLMPA